MALTQALRARLRSACPSGTKAIRPSKTRIKLAFMPLRPGLGSVAVGAEKEEQNTGETPTTIASAHASLRLSAVGVSYLLEMTKLQGKARWLLAEVKHPALFTSLSFADVVCSN